MFLSIKIFIILKFLRIVFSGHISVYDPIINYSNAGYATQIQLYFSLDNFIESSDFIMITNDDTNLLGPTVQMSILSVNNKQVCGPKLIQNDNKKFYLSPCQKILQSTWYILVIDIFSTKLQQNIIYNSIRIETLSSLPPNQIVYDYNNNFAKIRLHNNPKQCDLTFTYTSSDYQKLGLKYNITMKTQSVEIIDAQSIIRARLTQLDSSNVTCARIFTGRCTAEIQQPAPQSYPEHPDYDPFNPPDPIDVFLPCQMSPDQLNIEFSIGSYIIQIDKPITIIAEMMNPPFYVSSTTCGATISIFNKNQRWVYQAKTSVFGNLIPINFAYISNTPLLGWKLQRKSPSQMLNGSIQECPINLFYQPISAQNLIFNNVILQFQGQITPQNIRLIVTFQSIKCHIQEGSIETDFDNYQGKKVFCKFQSENEFQCINVAPLINKIYSISFKCAVLNADPVQLGAIQVKADLQEQYQGYSGIQLISSTVLPLIQIQTTAHSEYNKIGQTRWDQFVNTRGTIYSLPSSVTPDNVSLKGQIAGIKWESPTTRFQIVVLLSIGNNDPSICGDVGGCGLTTSTQYTQGVRFNIIMNGNVLTVDSNFLHRGALVITSVSNFWPTSSFVQYDTQPSSWLRNEYIQNIVINELLIYFLYCKPSQQTNRQCYLIDKVIQNEAGPAIVLQNIQLKSQAQMSITADQFSLNFFMCLWSGGDMYASSDSIIDNALQIRSAGLYSSYFINNLDSTSNIVFSYVNYYFIDSSKINDGKIMPTMVRIAAKFSNNAKNGITKLIAFFNYNPLLNVIKYRSLNDYSIQIGSTDPMASAKGYQINQIQSGTIPGISNQQFQLVNGDYSNHDQVVIQTTLQNTYVNYYFPIKADSSILHKEITIGLAYEINSIKTLLKSAYKIQSQYLWYFNQAIVMQPQIQSIPKLGSANNIMFSQVDSNIKLNNIVIIPPCLADSQSNQMSIVTDSNQIFQHASQSLTIEFNAFATDLNCIQVNNINNQIGAHFTVVSQNHNMFTDTIKRWDAAYNSFINGFCVSFYYNSTQNQTNYVLTCPYDVSDVTNLRLILENSKIPFQMGLNFPASQVITTAWSESNGNIQLLRRIPDLTTGKPLQCIVLPMIEYVSRLGINQNIKFNVITGVKITLNPQEQMIVSIITYDGVPSVSRIPYGFIYVPSTCQIEINNQQFSQLRCISIQEFETQGSEFGYRAIIENNSQIINEFFLGLKTVDLQNGVAININFYIDTNHKVKGFALFGARIQIYINSQLVTINDCSQVNQTQPFKVHTDSFVSSIFLITSIQKMIQKNVQQDLSISFSMGFPKNYLYTNEQIIFDIGYLNQTISNFQESHVQCQIKNEDGTINHDFERLTLFNNFASMVAKKKLPPQTWILSCKGASAPDDLLSNKPVQFDIKIKNTNRIIQNVTQTTKVLPLKIPAVVTLLYNNFKKHFNTFFCDATYQISLTSQKDLSISSKIYFQFHNSFSPKLNKRGQLYCEINQTQVDCEFFNDNYIFLQPSNTILKLISFNVLIGYVTQPISIPVNAQIYIALDYDGVFTNGIDEHVYINEIRPNSMISINQIHILSFDARNPNILLKTDFYFILEISKTLIKRVNQVMIILPQNFDTALDSTISVQCSIINIYSGVQHNDEICLKSQKRIFTMNIFLDDSFATNTQYLYYNITLLQVPTPSQQITIGDQPFIQIIDKLTTNVICQSYNTAIKLHKPFKGNLQPDFGISSNINLMTIETLQISVFKGFLGKSANLRIYTLGIFKEDIIIKLIGETSQYLTQYPSEIKCQIFQAYCYFQLTAKLTAPISKKILNFETVGASKYTNMPPLEVKILNTLCKIGPQTSKIQVIFRGTSLPILFDFSQCIPLYDMYVTVSLREYGSSDNLPQQMGMITKNNLTFAYDQTFKVFANQLTDNSYEILIQDRNENQITQKKFAQLTYKFQGLSSNYYDQSQSLVEIQRVEPPYNNSTILVNSTILPSQVKLEVSCSMESFFFYVISINQANIWVNWKTIREESYMKNTKLSPLDPFDYTNTQYGFEIIYKSNTSYPIAITNLLADYKYYWKGICINVANIEPLPEILSFQIPNNGGKSGLLMLLIDTKLSIDEQLRIACALSFRTFIKPELIQLKSGEFNKICLRRRMLENGTSIEEQYDNIHENQQFKGIEISLQEKQIQVSQILKPKRNLQAITDKMNFFIIQPDRRAIIDNNIQAIQDFIKVSSNIGLILSDAFIQVDVLQVTFEETPQVLPQLDETKTEIKEIKTNSASIVLIPKTLDKCLIIIAAAYPNQPQPNIQQFRLAQDGNKQKFVEYQMTITSIENTLIRNTYTFRKLKPDSSYVFYYVLTSIEQGGIENDAIIYRSEIFNTLSIKFAKNITTTLGFIVFITFIILM